jgi:hypothetical protein
VYGFGCLGHVRLALLDGHFVMMSQAQHCLSMQLHALSCHLNSAVLAPIDVHGLPGVRIGDDDAAAVHVVLHHPLAPLFALCPRRLAGGWRAPRAPAVRSRAGRLCRQRTSYHSSCASHDGVPASLQPRDSPQSVESITPESPHQQSQSRAVVARTRGTWWWWPWMQAGGQYRPSNRDTPIRT